MYFTLLSLIFRLKGHESIPIGISLKQKRTAISPKWLYTAAGINLGEMTNCQRVYVCLMRVKKVQQYIT